MSDLQRVALVTGGSRGIGRVIAKGLAQDGYAVYLTYVSRPQDAALVCDEIADAGGLAKAFQLDASDRGAVASFFADEIKGKVELAVLVNNAGITRDKLIMRMKDDDWDKVLSVNLSGPFAAIREAVKIMSKQRKGRIVNVASVVGQSGNPGQANYVAAKAGLIGLTKTTALELATRNVTVNAVAPGFISSDMTDALPEKVVDGYLARIPLGRMGSPEDVAAAVRFLASDGAGYITGQVLAVNGGLYM